MIRAAIYARYSSDNQTFASIQAQVEQCQEYCQRKGYAVVKIYTDEAKSGTTTARRDNYKLMLADARKDMYDIIIMHKIDRNARCEYDYYCFKNRILSLGKNYAYAAQGFDNSTPEGQLMENNLVGFAAYFSRNLGGEIKKGQKIKAESHLFLGGKPPLGYKIINQKYEIDEKEAPAVRMIFDMYLKGSGYLTIIEKLNQAGYRTKAGKMFGKNSIHDILANERYCGTYTFGRTFKVNGRQNSHKSNPKMLKETGAIPAIISPVQFDAARIKMAQNRHAPGTYRADYLLSGLVTCAYCGSRMCGNSSRKGPYRYRFYMCCKQSNHGVKTCENTKIAKEELESLVKKGLLQNLKPSNIDNVLAKAERVLRSGESKNAAQIKALAAQKTGAELKLNNMYNIIEAGHADNFDLARMSQIKKEITNLQQQIDNLKNQGSCQMSIDRIKEYWSRLYNAIKNKTDPAALRSVFQRAIKNIIVSREKVRIELVTNSRDCLVALMGIEPMISP